ncbi:Uncharacterized protein HZ326_11608 [Fusarium oxysporum f. sp. albedinis]|nr:Uncharacterized protein HZ326_11608 [Fusarium oxysporum f. sp. albedinis]
MLILISSRPLSRPRCSLVPVKEIDRTARQASRHSVPGSLCFPHVINLSDTEFDRQKRASTHIGPQINDGVARASEISKLP